MSDMSGHYDGEPVGYLHPDDAERLRSALAEPNSGDWAARARQSAKYAAEDAVRSLAVGRYALARQSLRDALGLLDEADALEHF